MVRHLKPGFTAILLAVTFVLSGCSFLQSMEPDTKQLAVQYATAKAIDGDPAKASRVVELVTEARAYVEDGARVSVSALYEGVRDRIDWDRLEPADQILITAILTKARDRLEEEIGAGLLGPDERLQILTVLDWIEGAAGGYVLTQT